ncbi:MAG: poly(R)-hydroxyalkanoic acid synthase subunit PhaE [Halobacteriales archaeon]|nr:poly(R)-hydroxyalkanoic acid synthase subunit PhaE [Halobacteriales archaeon]
MSKTTPMNGMKDWQENLEQMNEQFAKALEQNVEAQSKFMDAWMESIEESAERMDAESGVEGYVDAYETWMEAAQETVSQLEEAVDGEDVSYEQFRDTWLNAANQAFKDIMGTSAFAAATGQTVDEGLDMQQQLDEMTQSNLHDMGFATESDIVEVGERLIELERRQQSVERKLDRVLEHLEDGQ